MSDEEQPRTIQGIADAGADSIARWRASKRALRAFYYRRRMEQTKEPAPVAWLAAVDRDDERELVIEEQAA